MRTKYYYTTLLLMLFIQQFSFSQGYVFNSLIEDVSLSCGQGDIADGLPPGAFDTPELLIVGTGTNVRGVRLEGNNTGNYIAISPQELFCGYTFNPTLDRSNYCEDRYIEYINIRPDDNFKIITPNPGMGNRRTEITLEASPGYHPLVYNWQYFDIKDNRWKQFPSRFLGQSSITFDAEDLFGANAEDYIDESIQYKLELCNGWSPAGPYIYVFEFPSPEFKGATPSSTVCSYTEDGSFELKLGRNLFANEKLAVTIYEQDITTGNFTIIPTGGQNFSVTSLRNNGDGTFSYVWPRNLPAKTYRIKYQTARRTDNITQSSFNSLVFAGEVTIQNSPSVGFTVSKSDKNCFSTNDGYIDVQATGLGNMFFYQYRKDGQVQVVAGQSWIPFTSSTRISGLNEATYRVQVRQVREGKDCYAR
ncbi:hypothetical protein [Tenacibaculum agarivorans]|uniref:hypothetical protein n=1 Tax=Tenacibaculum agarivorans TaxID=1908389 RepID=UPI000B242FB9|nr:hypothetical protein [Tenacibaculum agarivorans]